METPRGGRLCKVRDARGHPGPRCAAAVDEWPLRPSAQAFGCPFLAITNATPPSTAIDASNNRNVTGSARNTMPPMAASTGTLSWTVAAVVALIAGSTEYQIT